jgi:hypothetical protein
MNKSIFKRILALSLLSAFILISCDQIRTMLVDDDGKPFVASKLPKMVKAANVILLDDCETPYQKKYWKYMGTVGQIQINNEKKITGTGSLKFTIEKVSRTSRFSTG